MIIKWLNIPLAFVAAKLAYLHKSTSEIKISNLVNEELKILTIADSLSNFGEGGQAIASAEQYRLINSQKHTKGNSNHSLFCPVNSVGAC